MQKPFVIFTAAFKIVTFSVILSFFTVGFSSARASDANSKLVLDSVRSYLWHVGPTKEAQAIGSLNIKSKISEELKIAIDKELSLKSK